MTEVLDDAANDAVIESSGNVFEDLGLELSSDEMIKIEVSRAIASRIRSRRLTQKMAAVLMKTDQAKVSKILCGKLSEFSTSRLFDFLTALGTDIDLRFSNTSSSNGRVRVSRVA